MHLTHVRAANFRLFEGFELEPGPRLNVVSGANAAGKTTLLEAIYTLGVGRSFRGGTNAEMAGPAAMRWQVQGRLQKPGSPPTPLTVQWDEDGTRLSLGATASVPVSELAQAFPVQVLEPGAHRLLEEGPAYRRRYLDWGLFHVEHQFFPTWRRYQRALRQRNQALRAGAPDAEVRAWDSELAETGAALHELRAGHLGHVRAGFGPLVESLLGAQSWELELLRGWGGDQPLAEHLDSHLTRDRKMGQTVDGPHRAELRLRLAGRTVKHRVSRGQQKLLIAALLLAQVRLIGEATGTMPALLVDDFPAELGREFQSRLLAALRDCGSQVFLTAVEPWPAVAHTGDAMFHVEHGRIARA